MKRFAVLAVFFCACGGSDKGGGDGDKSFCAIGNLTGIWRIQYRETDGTCGPLPDALAAAGRPATYSCTVHSYRISGDRCSLDLESTCPTTDDRGTQDWVIAMRQTSITHLEGSGTVQMSHPQQGVCQSTYDVAMDKI